MTAYNVWGTVAELAIKAGTYELRIHSIDLYNTSTGYRQIYFRRFEGSTFSGGSTVGIVSQREGAPTASATARQGNTLSLSTANQKNLGTRILPPGASMTFYESTGDWITRVSGSADTFQPPLDITISPGHVFSVYNLWQGADYEIGAIVYFEELRTSWTL